MEQKCMICGEPATGFFAENPRLPLCSLVVCEQALVDDINMELQAAAEAAKKENE